MFIQSHAKTTNNRQKAKTKKIENHMISVTF